MDRNQLARERSIVDQSQEQFLKQIIFPLLQAVQILGDRVAWIEMPFYKRWYFKLERPISLWFARRRKQPVAPESTPAQPVTDTAGEELRRQQLVKDFEAKEKATPAFKPVVESVNADVASPTKPRRLP